MVLWHFVDIGDNLVKSTGFLQVTVDQIKVNLESRFMKQTWLCGYDFYYHYKVIVLKKSFKPV